MYTDLQQSKRGISMAIACLVQTLNERDRTFQRRFIARLDAAHHEASSFRTGNPPGSDKNDHEALEPLTWIREMLTGESEFQAELGTFLSHYKPKG